MDQFDKKIWDLLGESHRPSPPPFFAGLVIRRIDEMKSPAISWLTPILRWLPPASVATLFVLALLPTASKDGIDSFSSSNEINALDIVQIVSPEDYAVLTSVGWPDEDNLQSLGF